MTFLYAALVILIICIFSCSFVFSDKDIEDKGIYMSLLKEFITIVMMAISIIFICYYISSEPTAMDVYQGKTTLEITYKNGVPVDSVVVLKGGEK